MSDGKSFDPRASSIYINKKSQTMVTVAGWVGVLLTFATIAIVLGEVRHPSGGSQPKVAALAAAWGMGGPMWFFLEYFWIYRKGGAPDSWELFKHGQQVSAAVWVALTASLTALAASDFLKMKEATYRCELNFSGTAAASAASTVVLSCTPAK